MERVPGDLHWRALGVCAHARVTTEPLLAGVLGAESAAGAFEWLRGLSFVEQGPAGLFPHDLAREVLEADLRWRDPDAYRALHGALARFLVRRLRGSGGPARQEAYLDLLFLVRHRDSNRPFYNWASFGHASAEVAPAESGPALVEMVRRHEGEQSARVARYWLARRPQDFVAFRDSAQQIVGFAAALLLESVSRAGRGRRSRPGRRLALRAGARAPTRGRAPAAPPLLRRAGRLPGPGDAQHGGHGGHHALADHPPPGLVLRRRGRAGALAPPLRADPLPPRPGGRLHGRRAPLRRVRPRLAGRPAPDLDRVQAGPRPAGRRRRRASRGRACPARAALAGGLRDRRARGPARLPSPPA